jgi:hypothetical protein
MKIPLPARRTSANAKREEKETVSFYNGVVERKEFEGEREQSQKTTYRGKMHALIIMNDYVYRERLTGRGSKRTLQP